MRNIKVIMLGTGSPRPSLERSPSSHLLLVDDLPIMVDCGDGAVTQLLKIGIEPPQIKHLFLTHLHADHVLGYGQFLIGGWAWGRRELTIVGPIGTQKFHERFVQMMEEDINYRLSLGRSTNGILDNVHIIEVEQPGAVSCELPMKISAERMVHFVPTFGYRFEIDDKVVVFSGDTAPTEAIVQLSRDADLLIHDAAVALTPAYADNPSFQKIWENLQKEHCTPAQAADTALRAGVKKLVLTHFLPGVDVQQVYQEASEVFSGTVIVASDLQAISVD